VRVLGALAVLDEGGRVDWKILALRADDPQAATLADIAGAPASVARLAEDIRTWFRLREVPRGGAERRLALDGAWPGREAALALPVTYYFRTQFHCDEDRVAHFMVGFESLTRANRRSGGIPAQGKWDGNGGSVWINGKELTPPVWKNPGQWRFEKATWGQPANEIPITDEEQYWCREPIRVELKKGDNLVLMRIPFTYAQQSIQGICAPVKKVGNRWIEDESMGNTPVR
jgi:hypothetical protein